MKLYLEILKNCKNFKGLFIFYLICIICRHSIWIYLPSLSGKLVENITTQNYHNFYYYIIIMIIVTLITFILGFVNDYLATLYWHNLYLHKVLEYREILLQKDYKTIIDIGTGQLITKFNRGIDAEIDMFFSILYIITVTGFRFTVLLILIFMQISYFSFIIIGLLILFYFINNYFEKQEMSIADQCSELDEINSRNVVRIIMEFLIVKLSNKKDSELKKGTEILNKWTKLDIKLFLINEMIYQFMSLIIRIIEILIYFLIGLMVLKGETDIATLFVLIGYIGLFRRPMDNLIVHTNKINKSSSAYLRLQEFLNIRNTIINGSTRFDYQEGKITFKNIEFGYIDKRKILESFSLDLLPRKVNALVGYSGSGKSTIIKLIMRFYDIQAGEISIDGQRIQDLEISTLYDHIGYLPQETSIFDGTIKENLNYIVNQELEDHILIAALNKAGLDKFVLGLPDGLNTEIGEKGIKLSGGERQRLGIARIFLKNPQILILDEPTSSLDSLAEYKITQVLNKLMKDKTVIVIAHRLQTVMNADKIFVINKGKLVEAGNHEQLLDTGNIYKKLVDLQHGKILE